MSTDEFAKKYKNDYMYKKLDVETLIMIASQTVQTMQLAGENREKIEKVLDGIVTTAGWLRDEFDTECEKYASISPEKKII